MPKSRQKFRSAEAKRAADELAASWEKLKKSYEPTKPLKWIKRQINPVVSSPVVRETQTLPSRVTSGASTAPSPEKKYTGEKVLGITIVHKSCLQPVFSDQEARDAASMRR